MKLQRVFTTKKLIFVILIAIVAFLAGYNYHSKTGPTGSIGAGVAFLALYGATWILVEALNGGWPVRFAALFGVGLVWGVCLMLWDMVIGNSPMLYGALPLSIVFGLGFAAATRRLAGEEMEPLPEEYSGGRLGGLSKSITPPTEE
jgi:hypothetical protein